MKQHFVVSVIISIGLIMLFEHFFHVSFISSGSMLPNIKVGDGVLVLRQHQLDDFEYADLVVFHHPKHPDELWLKRLIAKPDDKLVYRNRQLWLNAHNVTRQKHIESLYRGEQHRIYSSYLENAWGPVTVPEGHLFLMGDNRGISEDSRTFGPVPEEVLFGKVIWRFWKAD